MRIYSFALCKSGSQFKQEIEEKKLLTFQSKNLRKTKKKKSRRRLMPKKSKKNEALLLQNKRSSLKQSAELFHKISRNNKSSVSYHNETDGSRVNNTTVVIINPSQSNIAKSSRRVIRPGLKSVSEKSAE